MRNIAIFASGSGTNAENIISFFKESKTAKVTLLLANKKDAFAIERARKNSVANLTFSSNELKNSSLVLDALELYDIDVIILAGFLLLVPTDIIEKYRGRIINIHPALLPAYGGKGMYGEKVHEAVVAARESKSGITIHQVNEKFDDGDIIFQVECSLTHEDTPESVAAKIHELEQEHFPNVIDLFIDTLK